MISRRARLRRLVIETLAAPSDHRLGHGVHYLFEAAQAKWGEPLSGLEVMELLWGLLSEGLVFIDYGQSAPENWRWVLSELGRRAAKSEGEYEPDDAEGYLARLRQRLPDVDERILIYAAEGLRSYGARCYLACAVMLGVASERAFQVLGEAFATWLSNEESTRFRASFENPRQNYLAKFVEFRKRVEAHKPQLPAELTDNMSLSLDSVLDLLRVTRNEAGHPTGRQVREEDAYVNLQMFARYLETLYAFRRFFQKAHARMTS